MRHFKKMGRKAFGKMTLIGIFFLIIVFGFIFMYSKPVPKDIYLGKLSLELLKTRYDAEATLMFIDYSAKYALEQAIQDMNSNGGLTEEGNCGTHLVPLWNNNEKECWPDPEQGILPYFEERFMNYLAQHPGFPRLGYSYTAKQEDGMLVLKGMATNDLSFALEGAAEEERIAAESDWQLPLSGEKRLVTSCYGSRILQGGTDYHDGIDLAVQEGERVLAVASGTVLSVCEEWTDECACSLLLDESRGGCKDKPLCDGRCGNYGNNIIIKHSENLYTRYSHLKQVRVNEGDEVKQGEVIGSGGNTGKSTGPHLDLKVSDRGSFPTDKGFDPLCFFPEEELRRLKLGYGADSCKDDFEDNAFSKQNQVTRNNCEKIGQAVTHTTVMPEIIAVSEQAMTRLAQYEDSIQAYASEYAVEPTLIKAVILYESEGDDQAKSSAGARGLMQIMPELHYETCEESCEYTSKADYWDTDKNICCGTKILRDNFDMSQKPKRYDACCNDLGCVNEPRTYGPGWTQALRRYNGWGCGKWGDPLYAENVLQIYYDLGGRSISRYSNKVGEYRIRPNFKTKHTYDASIYGTLKEFTKELVEDYNNEWEEDYLAGKILEFNQAHDQITLSRHCTDHAFFNRLAEQYYYCLESEQENCLCSISLEQDIEEGEYEILYKDDELILYMKDGTKYGVESPLIHEMPIKMTNMITEDGKRPEVENMLLKMRWESISGSVEQVSMKLQGEGFDDIEGRSVLTVAKQGDEILHLENEIGLQYPACTPEPEYFTLCAESEESVRILFAVDIKK